MSSKASTTAVPEDLCLQTHWGSSWSTNTISFLMPCSLPVWVLLILPITIFSQVGLRWLISSAHISRGQVERQVQAQKKPDSTTLFQQKPCCQPKAQLLPLLKGKARAKQIAR